LKVSFVSSRDQASPACLTDRLVEESRCEVRLDAVREGPERDRDRHGAEARAIALADVAEMEHETRRYPEAAAPPRGRQRQVGLAREIVRTAGSS